VFIDILENDTAAKQRLEQRIDQLTQIAARSANATDPGRDLTDAEKNELQLLQTLDQALPIFDPLFFAVKNLFQEVLQKDLPDPKIDRTTPDASNNGSMPGIESPVPHDTNALKALSVYGVLSADRAIPPNVTLSPPSATPVMDESDANADKFRSSFIVALGEVEKDRKLIDATFPFLVLQGYQPINRRLGSAVYKVRTTDIARVVRALVQRGIAADDYQLGNRVSEVLASFNG